MRDAFYESFPAGMRETQKIDNEARAKIETWIYSEAEQRKDERNAEGEVRILRKKAEYEQYLMTQKLQAQREEEEDRQIKVSQPIVQEISSSKPALTETSPRKQLPLREKRISERSRNGMEQAEEHSFP